MLQDSVDVVVPVISSGPELIMYLITLAAGAVSGVVVRGLSAIFNFVGKLGEAVKLGILAIASFAGLQLATFFGLSLPENPFLWDATVVNTVISTIIGWLVVKQGKIKKTAA